MSSYLPQSNGGTEIFNKTLLESFRNLLNVRQDNWEEQSHNIEFAYNALPNAATGMLPFKLTLGQDPRSPIDALFRWRWILSKMRNHSTMRTSFLEL